MHCSEDPLASARQLSRQCLAEQQKLDHEKGRQQKIPKDLISSSEGNDKGIALVLRSQAREMQG